ncbi:hypothetical protein FACS1894124_2250 [Spirochaetia bacterium]|nr:hypothetical protein FACS1894124_2250 [Spirochaetia bacterium]
MKKHFYRLGRSAALISVFLLAAVGVLFMACPTSDTPTPDTAVAFTGVSADGSATTATTTKLTLTFDQAITDLAADDITLSRATVTKGTLTSTATAGKYELAVSGITASRTVTVSVVKGGYNISGNPQTASVYYYNSSGTAVTFNSAVADGGGTVSTSKLTLTFDQAITGLGANDITLSGLTGVTKGALTGTGPVYELTVTGITASGPVTVSAAKTGYNISGNPQTAQVYYYNPTATAVTFNSAVADGGGTVSTSKLTLTFSQAITGLAADDITLSGLTGVTKGALTGTGPVYELPISGITASGPVTVSVVKGGYNISGNPQTAQVYYYNPTATAVTFNSAVADGGGTVSTSRLTLTFSQAITGLAADDITLSGLTGVTKGTLTGTGPVYELPISGITASGPVTVSVVKGGYNISGNPQTAQVYYYNPTATAVTFNSAVADGGGTVSTSKLTLTFSQAITGLAADDITLSGSTGAAKGTLTGTGPVYELPISGITASGPVTVSVVKGGYNISGNPQTVQVYYYNPTATAVTFNSAVADGGGTVSTSKLTLTFSQAITGLGANDITLSGSTGAAKGTLTGTGPVYELTVTGITASGPVTVSAAKTGYTISGGSKTVNVYYYDDPEDIAAAFINLIADGDATATTTKLTLTFDKAIANLAAGDITLSGSTGATKGALTPTGTAGVYELAVTVTADGTVTVSAEKDGYNISGGSKTVNVYYYDDPEDIAAEFTGLIADGDATATTTKLTLTFSQAITGLSADDITLSGSTGVTKGALTPTGTAGVYELAVTVTASGSVTVTVAKDGYTISDDTKSVQVYYVVATPVVPQGVNAAPLYKTVSADRGNSSAASALDGSRTTRWTISANADSSVNANLTLDFGYAITANAAVISIWTEQTNHFQSIGSVQIDFSTDGETWTSTTVQSSPALIPARYDTGSDASAYWVFFDTDYTGRYARLSLTTVMGRGAGVWEFELYNAFDRDDLNTKIAAADILKDTTEISADGLDVYPANYWVTSAVANPFLAALGTAQTVAQNPAATEREITDALSDLTTTSANVTSSRVLGSMAAVSKTALIAAIAAAKGSPAKYNSASGVLNEPQVVGIQDYYKVAANGNDLYQNQWWVTAEARTTYVNAITDAVDVQNDTDATQKNVNDAVTALANATTAFDATKSAGIKRNNNGDNIARRYQTVMANSVYGRTTAEVTTTYAPSTAVDGDVGTRWATEEGTRWATEDGTRLPYILTLDFGARVTLNNSVLKPRKAASGDGTGAGIIKDFTIEYSNDGITWQTAYEYAEDGQEIQGARGNDYINGLVDINSYYFSGGAITASRFRLRITSSAGEPSLWEWELYNRADNTALNAAIAAANKLKDYYKVGTTASAFRTNQLWVTAEKQATYQGAIDAAVVVRGNTSATQADVDNALAALGTGDRTDAVLTSATYIFNNAAQSGSTALPANANIAIYYMAAWANSVFNVDNTADKAFDGLRNTRWAADYVTPSGTISTTNPIYLSVDFGQQVTVAKSIIAASGNTTSGEAHLNAYTIEWSNDGNTWTTVTLWPAPPTGTSGSAAGTIAGVGASDTGPNSGDGVINIFTPAVTASQFRLVMTGHPTVFRPSLWEWELWSPTAAP